MTEPRPATPLTAEELRAELHDDLREGQGLSPGELADRLLARGWTLDAARPSGELDDFRAIIAEAIKDLREGADQVVLDGLLAIYDSYWPTDATLDAAVPAPAGYVEVKRLDRPGNRADGIRANPAPDVRP